MFDYTHEVIINSNVGTLEGNKRIGTYDDLVTKVTHLLIERAGDYREDLIFPRGAGIVFKTPGHDGELATLTITAPDSVTAGDVYQFSVFVKMLDPAAIAEYAYPNWASFGKPIVVGFTHKTNGVFLKELAAALKDAIPYNNKFVNIKLDDNDNPTSLVLTACMFGLEFDGAKLEILDNGSCDPCNPEKYDLVDDDYVASKTIIPFGTAEKLIENYRFPTYANTRYASVNSDETPIPGVIYTMYSFSYDSPRPGFGGISGVGQKVDAVTRHIYWVASNVVNDFDAALAELNVTVKEQDDSSSNNA